MIATNDAWMGTGHLFDINVMLLTLDRDNLPGTLPDEVVAETAYEWMLNEGAPS